MKERRSVKVLHDAEPTINGTARRGEREQGVQALSRIVVVFRVQQRIERGPVLLQQPLNQLQAVEKSGQAAGLERTAAQHHSYAKMLRVAKELRAPFLEYAPIRRLSRLFDRSDLHLGFAFKNGLQRFEPRVVGKVRTTRLLRGNRQQQFLNEFVHTSLS